VNVCVCECVCVNVCVCVCVRSSVYLYVSACVCACSKKCKIGSFAMKVHANPKNLLTVKEALSLKEIKEVSFRAMVSSCYLAI